MKTDELFEALSKSIFRSKFHLRETELQILQKKGIETIREHAKTLIKNRLCDAYPTNDGKQTPYRGHPVFIAQHATATGCRSCLLKWHKIEKNVAITENDQEYIVEVIVQWILKDVNRTKNNKQT